MNELFADELIEAIIDKNWLPEQFHLLDTIFLDMCKEWSKMCEKKSTSDCDMSEYPTNDYIGDYCHKTNFTLRYGSYVYDTLVEWFGGKFVIVNNDKYERLPSKSR